MPSKSPEQRRFMAAVANNPAFAKKVGVPASVGKEFSRADKAKGYSTRAGINNPNTAHGKLDMPFHSVKSNAKGGEMKSSKDKMMAMMQKKKAPAAASKGAMPGMGMKKGGRPMKDGKPAFLKKMMGGGMAYAKGGGIESRGKTKGTMVKMAKGGRAC
jgi:hypothetical protein